MGFTDMIRIFLLAFATLLLAAPVIAHGTWPAIWINGVDHGSYCARKTSDINPMDYNSTDLACKDASASRPENLCKLKPGDTVIVEFHYAKRGCFSESFLPNHYGPVVVYLAPVADAKTALGAEADWFKIYESGLISNNPKLWASEVGYANCGHVTIKIPDVSPGQYLLRAETIALHFADKPNKAQLFPGCFQVEIGGSGTAKPDTVKIPGVYGEQDPGILINVSKTLDAYTIPGPRPYGYTAPPMATTKVGTAATWNTNAAPTTIPATPVPNSGGPPMEPYIAQWAQCGGVNWKGGTQCIAPYTCQELNPYYFQCL